MGNRMLTLGIPDRFDPRRISPGNLVAWYDATRVINRADGDPLLVWRNLVSTSALPQWDTFTRADSTTTLGSAESGATWTAVAGTWGISSNKAYSVTDADLDLAVMETSLADCVVSCVVNGDLTITGSNYSIPLVVFRCTDSSNFLYINMYAGNIYVKKRDGGVVSDLTSAATTTTDNTDYTIRVVSSGNSITVYKDGTSVLTHTLAGGNTKYAAYTKHGMCLSRAGTPSFNARWDNFIVARLSDAIQGTTASMPTYKTGIQNSRPVVRFDGGDYLLHQFGITTAPVSTFIVFKRSGGAAGYQSILYFDHVPLTARVSGTNVWGTYFGQPLPTTHDASTVFTVASVVTTSSTTTLMVSNGSEEPRSNGASFYTASGYRSIGARSNGVTTSEYFTGDIAAILVFSAALSTTQRRKTEKGLSRTWGVSLVNTICSDTYTRSDSASTLGSTETGQAYTAVAGTWGVSSNKAYSVTNADADQAVVESGKADCTVQFTVSGDLNGVDYSIPGVVVRATDSSNFLYVHLYGGACVLNKRDGGVGSTLTSGATTTTDNTDYTVRVVMSGNSITIYKNGTSVVTHTLAGGDTKYAAYTKHGMRLAKAGTPSYNARWDNLSIEG